MTIPKKGALIIISGVSFSRKHEIAALLAAKPTIAVKASFGKLPFKLVRSFTDREPMSHEVGNEYDWLHPTVLKQYLSLEEMLAPAVIDGVNYGIPETTLLDALEGGPQSGNVPHNAIVVVDPRGRDELIEWANQHGIKYLPVFVKDEYKNITQEFMRRVRDASADSGFGQEDDDSFGEEVDALMAKLTSTLAEERYWKATRDCYLVAGTSTFRDARYTYGVVAAIRNRVAALHESHLQALPQPSSGIFR